jgi:TRAP-type C4-dicarboxylate transport system permease small subunit
MSLSDHAVGANPGSARGVLAWLACFNAALGRTEARLSVVLMALLLALNGYAVAARFLVNRYPPWVIEVSEALMVWMVFLGGAWLYRAKQHIAVEIFMDALPDGAGKRWIVTLGELAVLAFVLVVLWQAVLYQPILLTRKTPVLGWPANLPSIIMIYAYAAILLAGVERLLRGGR